MPPLSLSAPPMAWHSLAARVYIKDVMSSNTTISVPLPACPRSGVLVPAQDRKIHPTLFSISDK